MLRNSFEKCEVIFACVLSGGDWRLLRPDGVLDFDARYLLRTDDGTVIYMQNRGYRWGPPEMMAALSRREPVDA